MFVPEFEIFVGSDTVALLVKLAFHVRMWLSRVAYRVSRNNPQCVLCICVNTGRGGWGQLALTQVSISCCCWVSWLIITRPISSYNVMNLHCRPPSLTCQHKFKANLCKIWSMWFAFSFKRDKPQNRQTLYGMHDWRRRVNCTALMQTVVHRGQCITRIGAQRWSWCRSFALTWGVRLLRCKVKHSSQSFNPTCHKRYNAGDGCCMGVWGQESSLKEVTRNPSIINQCYPVSVMHQPHNTALLFCKCGLLVKL